MKTNVDVPPAFIVGVPRSGTTLLVNLLGQHPLLAPIYETRFLRNLLLLCEKAEWYLGDAPSRRIARLCCEAAVRARFAKACDHYKRKAVAYNVIPDEGDGTKQSYEFFPFGESHCVYYRMEEFIEETELWLSRIRANDLTPEALRQSARAYVEKLFAIHCERMKKPFWINKTPGLLTYVDLLPALFPGSKCIHIVRDGRDVAVSNLSLSWGPNTVQEAARRWKKLMVEGRKKVDPLRMSYREVRYEDLVEQPRPTLKEIYNFLNIADDAGDFPSGLSVSSGRINGWRSKFSAADRRVFAKEAGDLLIALGYAADDSWV